MKKQARFTAAELRTLFEAKSKKFQNAHQKEAPAVQELSRAVSDLQKSGIDVQIHFTPYVHEDAWAFVKKASDHTVENANLLTSGVLQIEGRPFLLALSDEEDGEKSLGLYVSHRDFTAGFLQHDGRGECFDLLNDGNAIRKFQKHVITVAAEIRFFRENDVENAFGDKSLTLNKPSLLSPKGSKA